MSEIRISEHAAGLHVSAPAGEIEHLAAAGGAWSSIVLRGGPGGNLLRAPLTSSLRLLRPGGGKPGTDGTEGQSPFSTYSEQNEKSPRLWTETAGGVPIVVAEGTYRDAEGRPIPVGYRRRTAYHQHGLVWTTLEIMSDSGCDGVVEARTLELPLRGGLTDCLVRLHPTQGGGADLLGAHGRFALQREGRHAAFLSRYTPLQIVCRGQSGAGIEVFPGSELAEWDCALKPDTGLGLYSVACHADGADVLLAPYCMALRRMPARIQGTVTLRLGIGLPLTRQRAARDEPRHVLVTNRCAGDQDFVRWARAGVALLRYQDSCHEGAFWRNGAYPPYDEAGMRELRRMIEAAHRHGLKIVPYVSLKELHPETPAWREYAAQWMHMAAHSLGSVHTWVGNEQRGGLMCMRSGWSGYCRQYVETLLSALPWDGLELDLAIPHACCHSEHGRGPFHTDVESVLDFVCHCRERVGAQGLLVLRGSAEDSVLLANLADVFAPAEAPGKCLQSP